MPGIAGIIGASSHPENLHVLDAMIRSMVHEPFDHRGTEAEKTVACYAGWVCQKGSFADCMPVWNEQRNVCLIFSGETFADASEIKGLTDTEGELHVDNARYLVRLYEQLGVPFLEQLNGWFAGVIIDLRKKQVVLFNDRYGLSRIYFHENERGLFFASEAKALLQVLPELRRFDRQGLGELFACGCVLQNRTLFHNIALVPGGSVWSFSPRQPVRKETYFKRESWERQSALAPVDFAENLKATWPRALRRYFRGPERVALSLTGGVDSRMILAWAPSRAGTLPCYTFGGRYRDCRDVRLARKVARICGHSHQVIPIGQEFLDDFPALAEKTVYVSDGYMDVTGAIDLYVQRAARQIAPVRITGTNGGEILRRLVAFKPMPVRDDLLAPEISTEVRAAGETYRKELDCHKLSFTAFKQTPWYMCSKFAIERSQLTLRMPYFDNDLVALSYRAPRGLAESNEPALKLIAEGNPALERIGTDRGLAARAVPGITGLLHAWQQFTFKAEYAYDYGMPQWLAAADNRFSALHFERLFLGRHKFHHFRVFYRDELSEYVKAVLLDPRTLARSYWQAARVKEMVNGHLQGSRNYTLEIHKLLTLELIERQLLEPGR